MSEKHQLKITVDKTLAESFKHICEARHVSMSSVLQQFMSDYTCTPMKHKSSPDYSTRRKRRNAVAGIALQLLTIKECEEQYRDRIPENLQGSIVYEKADEFVNSLEEALDILLSS